VIRRFTVLTLLLVLAASFVIAEDGSSANPGTKTAPAAEASTVVNTSVTTPSNAVSDPLLRILVNKGILTPGEAANLHGNPAANQQLLQILLTKGILSDSDLISLHAQPTAGENNSANANGEVMAATLSTPVAQAPAPAPPPVIPGVAPVRVLPIDTPKRDGLIPALKLGPVKATFYGFLRMSTVYDTSQPRGDDFPLPGWAVFTDTGPTTAAEFHVKARNSRFGLNTEWLDKSEKLAITGRMEFDFEGNFTAVDNRNISAARSSQPSLRLAYGRLDYTPSPGTTFFSVFGQDWTPFGSSTLPNTLEASGVGISFGSLYERAPLVKGGFVHNFGGDRNIKGIAEVAAVSPMFGNVPSGTQFQIPGTVPGAGSGSNVFTITGCATPPCGTVTIPQVANTGLGLQNQLAFGERQGADSGRPEVEARIGLQFQLDKAPGVAPAQILLAGVQGERVAVVPFANIPNAPAALGTGFYKAAFPHGIRVSSDRYGINPSIQLPTRYFTLISSFYHGADLRWFFAGELFSYYNNTVAQGLTNTVTAPSADGSAAVVLGTVGGAATVAQQKPVRTSGGFVELGLPLSRWANANPTGRNAGWTMNLHYGIDDANANDIRKVAGAAASSRDKSDWAFGNLQYKLNTWVTFGFEEALYRTRAIPNAAGAFSAATSIEGIPSREWKDIRSEFQTTFTF